MIEISGSDTLSYVLPLENIDLSYLSKYVSNSTDKVPLWSKKQLDGELEYFEIKITPQEFDDDDCYYEPSNTYKCHICNIDVPTIFFKEHNESLKHKKMKNIFEKVLERASKHFGQNIDNNYKDNNQEVYYCVPCSKTVKRKNKYKHEATGFHTNSVKNIEILNDFHDIFIENNIKDDLNSIEDEILENENRIDTPPPIVLDNLDSDTENNNFDNFNDGLLNAFNDFNNSTIIPTVSEKDEETFEVYLRNVKSKYNQIIDLPEVEGEYVYIVNPIGIKAKIPQAHYQGYRAMANKIYCILCNKWLEDITAHDQKESHVRHMLKPIAENFSRVFNSVTSNCLVCNEMFMSISDHCISDRHKIALQNMKVIQTSQFNDVTKANKTLCGICNVYIDTHNFIAHTNSKKHKNLSNCVNSNAHITSKKPKLSPKYYCTVCKVDVPGGGKESHEKGQLHTQEIDKKRKNVAQNGSPSVANNSYSKASTSNNTHSNNSPNSIHQKSDDNYYKLLKVSIEAGKHEAICKVCNVKVPYVRQNIKEHMEGYLHKQEVEAFKKILEVIDEKKVKCKICNVIINYVDFNIIEHMTGNLHTVDEFLFLEFHTVTKKSDAYFCDCCNETFRYYLDHINSDSHIRSFQDEVVIDKGLMRKYVYDVDVNQGSGLIYKELYKKLLRVNHINKINNKFVCRYCDITMGRISEIDHMLGERHRQCVESAEETDESDD